MASTISSTACAKPKTNAPASSTDIDFSKMTKLTELQKIMATKAVKMPGENNPIAIHKLTADPCVLIYKDTIYVYGTNDAQQAESSKGKIDNQFNLINTLNDYTNILIYYNIL